MSSDPFNRIHRHPLPSYLMNVYSVWRHPDRPVAHSIRSCRRSFRDEEQCNLIILFMVSSD